MPSPHSFAVAPTVGVLGDDEFLNGRFRGEASRAVGVSMAKGYIQ